MTVGTEGFSGATAEHISLAFSPSDIPYVAYKDFGNLFGTTVKRFDGTNWVTVGTEGFSGNTAEWLSLAFSLSGEPYLAYKDFGNSFGTTVKRFDGTNWVTIGTEGFSGTTAEHLSLAFSLSGKPYLAYKDFGNSFGTTVKEYDTLFVNVGIPQQLQFSIFPNPTYNTLTIDFGDAPTTVNFIEVTDIMGKIFFQQQPAPKKININVENYPDGIYIVKMRTSSFNFFRKFIKDH